MTIDRPRLHADCANNDRTTLSRITPETSKEGYRALTLLAALPAPTPREHFQRARRLIMDKRIDRQAAGILMMVEFLRACEDRCDTQRIQRAIDSLVAYLRRPRSDLRRSGVAMPDSLAAIAELARTQAISALDYVCRTGVKARGTVRVDITGADLRTIRYHEFTGQLKLSHVNLAGADLSHTEPYLPLNISHSNLAQANLEESDLEGAQFKESNLTAADLTNADLTEANFEGASLKHANIDGSHSEHASFWGADLRNANLSAAGFDNCTFDGANFAGARFDYADLRKTDLSRARGLTHAVGLDKAILTAKQQQEIYSLTTEKTDFGPGSTWW